MHHFWKLEPSRGRRPFGWLAIALVTYTKRAFGSILRTARALRRPSRPVKLAFGLFMTLGFMFGLGFVLYDSTRTWTNSAGETYSSAATRIAQRRAAEGVDHAARLFRANTPDGQAFGPGIPPVEALRQMIAYGYVRRAYYLDAAGQFWLAEKALKTGQISWYTYDLNTWRPKTLRPQGEKSSLPAASSDASPDSRLSQLREAFVENVTVLHAGELSGSSELEPGAFRGLRPLGFRQFVLFEKRLGSDRLGFELADYAYYSDLGAYTDRYGPSVTVWTFSEDKYPNRSPGVRLGADLRYLSYGTFPSKAELAEAILETVGLLLVLGAGCWFALVFSMREIRAMIDEGSLALAQSNFVSAVSHEMRTPLTTIKMYAEMLELGLVTDEAQRSSYLKAIGQESERLTTMVEGVLDYSRLKGGYRTYHFEPLNVRACVDEALASLQGPLKGSGVAVNLDVPHDLSLEADRATLVQALVNVIGNAIKYAGNARPYIQVSASQTEADVYLEVRDFGPGIPPSEQQRIFEPFHRIGNELTRETVGSGLGLTLVQEYLVAHHGHIELESKMGEGSRFRLVLPKERKPAS